MSAASVTRADLARRIDHTLLKPEATQVDIGKLCDECLRYHFAAACVNGYWISSCAARLAGSSTAVAAVVGFPLGAMTTEAKVFETTTSVAHGAREIDMVVNLGALSAGDRTATTRDIAAVVDAAKQVNQGAQVKVILETAALDDDKIKLGCECAAAAHADYVKTSSGFHPAGGATVRHVQLLREYAGDMQVKAAGGIRDLATAQSMIEAGADRLGMSASVAIIEAVDE